MDWAYVLVIILSIFLAIFLLLGIILVIMLIRVTMQIKKVTESAEKTANNIQSIVGNVGKLSSPALIASTILRQAKKLKKRKEK